MLPFFLKLPAVVELWQGKKDTTTTTTALVTCIFLDLIMFPWLLHHTPPLTKRDGHLNSSPQFHLFLVLLGALS